MKIAVIGTGISGLTAAYVLQREHEISVFEAGEQIGGHTATVDVELGGRTYAVDTGFIVYNDWTYPNFIRLMTELGCASQPTEMGFSVKLAEEDYEYSGSSLGSLFASRRNLLNPAHWRMLRDILRFNREAIVDLESGRIDGRMALGEYLQEKAYGDYFVERYLVPMGSAIWSASTRDMRAFPLEFFVRFFKNHGLLSVSDRPQWRVLVGGSRSYLKPITAGFQDRIHTRCPITAIRRDAEGVWLRAARSTDPASPQEQRFDQVIVATHSDQALAMLSDPTREEREVLGAIPYQDNDVVLHTDASVLPRRRLAWSSWNYALSKHEQARAALTYDMNILQSINAPETFCVTLNNTQAIAPEKILRRFNYAHPVFTHDGMLAQQRWSEINGMRRTWYCGAYWRNGFHEDGVVSALKVCESLGVRW